MKARLITLGATIFVLGAILLPVAAVPASATPTEIDNVWLTVSAGGYNRGSAYIQVDWPYGPAWTFDYVQVKDLSADGHCITPFVKVNRRGLPNTGWMFLNGNRLEWWSLSSTTYGTTCGSGKVYQDPYGTNVYGPRPYSGLTGAYGVWLTVCQTNSKGAITGACSPVKYAANNGA